jgi:hypothetical protein
MLYCHHLAQANLRECVRIASHVQVFLTSSINFPRSLSPYIFSFFFFFFFFFFFLFFFFFMRVSVARLFSTFWSVAGCYGKPNDVATRRQNNSGLSLIRHSPPPAFSTTDGLPYLLPPPGVFVPRDSPPPAP